jgi:hypothetical protein
MCGRCAFRHRPRQPNVIIEITITPSEALK